MSLALCFNVKWLKRKYKMTQTSWFLIKLIMILKSFKALPGCQESLPESVWSCNTTSGEQEDWPAPISITETSNDGRGDELQEGEERAEQTSKQDRDETVWSSDQRPKTFDIRFLGSRGIILEIFVLNVGHFQGDPFRVPHNSLQKANATAID